jgi:hypothetical protein
MGRKRPKIFIILHNRHFVKGFSKEKKDFFFAQKTCKCQTRSLQWTQGQRVKGTKMDDYEGIEDFGCDDFFETHDVDDYQEFENNEAWEDSREEWEDDYDLEDE